MNLINKFMTAKKSVAKKVTKQVSEESEVTSNLCETCEGKGTVREGTRICPDCNGDCFK